MIGVFKGYAKALHTINLANSNHDKLDLSSLGLTSANLQILMPLIKRIRGLKFLILNDNQLSTLPDEIGTLTKLEKLGVKKNDLTELPAAIGALTSLELLDASENKLSKLPKDLGELTRLKKLALFDNKISELPPEMAALSSLRLLILGKNKFEHFPEVLLQLKHLEQLSIGENCLSELPQEFGGLKALKSLCLYHNNFQFFPPGILELEALEILNIAENRLLSLPSELVNMQQLEDLDLHCNFITYLPEKFGNLVNLERLNVRRNWLQELPDNFGALASLEVVDLSDNTLRTLPNTMTALSPRLELILDISTLQRNARELLSNNFNRFSGRRTAVQNTANHYKKVLEQLYPSSHETIHDQIEAIGLGDLEVTEQRSRSAVAVLKEFLSKVPLEHAHNKEVYHPVVKLLLETVLNKTLTEEERQLTLQKMLTALGGCGSAVTHFLTQTFVFECMDKERPIPNIVQDILIAMGVEKAIRITLKDQLKGPEAIEQVAALLHCLFLKNAVVMKCNGAKIHGIPVRLPPFSRHVKFGFTQISEKLAEAFLKLCCQEKDGQLIQQQGRYLPDHKKISIMMVNPFLADLDPALASPRELLVRDYEEKIKILLLAHDLTLWTDKEDVKELLQIYKHQEELRKLLLYAPDDKIEEAYHKFLRKKEFEAFSLDIKYNRAPKAKHLLAFTNASAQKMSSLKSTSMPTQNGKLHRKHSM